MRFIKELGVGASKKALLYDSDGEKMTILKSISKSKKRSFLWQSRKEANITQKLPPLRCDIRTVYVKRKRGEWEVSAHYVEGSPLNQERFESLSAEKQEKIIGDFAEFLLALHSLDVTMVDERYADETDTAGPIYLLGVLFYKIYCLKKHYLSLKKPWKNPFATRRFEKEKQKLYQRFEFAPNEMEQMEKLIQTVCSRPDLFAYMGVCFGDFLDANFIYDEQAERLGVLDFVCTYKNNIYCEFVGIYAWMGKEFTRRLVSAYNEQAARQDVHLPKCAAYPLKLDFTMVQHLMALCRFRQMPQEPQCREELMQLLQELYPRRTPA